MQMSINLLKIKLPAGSVHCTDKYHTLISLFFFFPKLKFNNIKSIENLKRTDEI